MTSGVVSAELNSFGGRARARTAEAGSASDAGNRLAWAMIYSDLAISSFMISLVPP